MSITARFFWLLMLAAALSACDGMSRAPARPFAEVGTRALIKSGGRDFLSEIVAVEGRLVGIEFRATEPSGAVFGRYDYYRGLLPISGSDDGSRFEIDYDDADAVERFFPVKPGKTAELAGSMQFIDTGISYPLMTSLKAMHAKTITLDSGPEEVVTVKIVTVLYEDDGSERDRREQLVYYAPKLSMVLKNVRKERGRAIFWRVVGVERVDSPTPRLRRRRAGTVAV